MGGRLADVDARLPGAVLRHLLWFVGLVVGVIVLVQVLLWAAPGDPVALVGGEDIRAGLEAEWGLDQPLWVRTGRFLSGALHGDLGSSLTVRPGADVSGLIVDSATRSLGLLAPALLLSLGLSLVLAWSSRRWRLVHAVSVAPTFLLAHLLVFTLNEGTFALLQSGRITRPDWFALPLVDSPMRSALAITILAVGSGALSGMSGELSAAMKRIRESAWLEAAATRGTPLYPHILGNLLPPLLVSLASQVAFLAGGLVIVEKVLLLNGAGALMWESALQRDYPLSMGLALLAGVTVCGARLIADLARLTLDPRLRIPR
ncbi:MAG: peptide/nickel transport system permease protein [Myxococcota bacterium]|jgi:peptide/nickel transport system permease protein